jgi:sterol 3beta-glucosyltransferase
MRVAMLSHGTRGDVQPFIALALELQVRGHEVAICGPCSTSDLVRSHGIEAHSLTFDAKKMVNSEALQAAMKKGDGNECVKAYVEETKKQKSEGAHSPEEVNEFIGTYQPDVVIGHPSLMSFIVVAEKHGLPVVSAMFMPWLPSRFSHPCFQTLAAVTAQGYLDNPLETHRQLYHAFLNENELQELNALREGWGLQPYGNLSEMHAAFTQVPTANCWSTCVVPEPADMNTEFPLSRQTGYLFLDEATYEPPSELLAFLKDKKPVYIGFGSLAAGDPREVTEKVLRALIAAGGKSCVMLGGWSGIGPEHLDSLLTKDYPMLKQFADKHVLKMESVPHSWLLSQCSGAIHHGGAGTTGAVARAGIPTAIAPFAWDQPWWAERMEALGVGIALSTMITKLSVEELGNAITRLTSDVEMAENAAALGAQIRSELSGVKQLADFVEGAVSAPFPWPTKVQPVGTPLLPPLWDKSSAKKSQGLAEPCLFNEKVSVQGGA